MLLARLPRGSGRGGSWGVPGPLHPAMTCAPVGSQSAFQLESDRACAKGMRQARLTIIRHVSNARQVRTVVSLAVTDELVCQSIGKSVGRKRFRHGGCMNRVEAFRAHSIRGQSDRLTPLELAARRASRFAVKCNEHCSTARANKTTSLIWMLRAIPCCRCDNVMSLSAHVLAAGMVTFWSSALAVCHSCMTSQ